VYTSTLAMMIIAPLDHGLSGLSWFVRVPNNLVMHIEPCISLIKPHILRLHIQPTKHVHIIVDEPEGKDSLAEFIRSVFGIALLSTYRLKQKWKTMKRE